MFLLSFLVIFLSHGSTNSNSNSNSYRRVGVAEAASPLNTLQDISKSIINRTRRTINLSNIIGSPTSVPSYERLASQPVFTVTTPWGSPYLLFERSDRTESQLEFDDVLLGDDNDNNNEMGMANGRQQQENTNKQVALYFMDEEDAMRLRDEMLQMEQMSGVDMRITASSLGKALSQCKNLNKGLMTGQPINVHTGNMKSPEEGGVLRYKIVPPKRELFYAARCVGRERVGLWNVNPEDDAKLMLSSVPVIGGTLAMMRKAAVEKRKREKRRAGTGAGGAGSANANDDDVVVDPIREQYKHMEGFVGVPVFHCPEMKKYNKIKGILRNEQGKVQTPLYFSYEDLMDSWNALKKRESSKKRSKNNNNDDDNDVMPDTPNVEVYNMMDVVTSMDRNQWNIKRAAQLQRDGLLGKIPLINKLTGTEGSPLVKKKDITSTTNTGLDDIVFIPNSKSTSFKEMITSVGNGQARLRPMRPWGKDTM